MRPSIHPSKPVTVNGYWLYSGLEALVDPTSVLTKVESTAPIELVCRRVSGKCGYWMHNSIQ